MAVDFCLLVALLLIDPFSESIVGPSDGLPAKFDAGLIDINEVDTAVEIRRYPTIDANDSEFSSHLEKLIRTRLQASGIHVFDPAADARGTAMGKMLGRKLNVDPNTLRWRRADVPILRAAVHVVSLGQDGPVALYARVSLARLVCLDGRTAPSFKATVWGADPVVESVPSSRWRDETQKVVTAQVEAFIDACESTRKPLNRSTAAEPNKSLGRTKSSPETAQTTLPFLFVASKSGSVFHRPDCRWAQNISGDNRLDYRTREEALQTGKRPCRSCKP